MRNAGRYRHPDLFRLNLIQVAGLEQVLRELALTVVALDVLVAPLADGVVECRLRLGAAQVAHVLLEVLHQTEAGEFL